MYKIFITALLCVKELEVEVMPINWELAEQVDMIVMEYSCDLRSDEQTGWFQKNPGKTYR